MKPPSGKSEGEFILQLDTSKGDFNKGILLYLPGKHKSGTACPVYLQSITLTSPYNEHPGKFILYREKGVLPG